MGFPQRESVWRKSRGVDISSTVYSTCRLVGPLDCGMMDSRRENVFFLLHRGMIGWFSSVRTSVDREKPFGECEERMASGIVPLAVIRTRRNDRSEVDRVLSMSQ